MATIHPSDWSTVQAQGSAARQIETLERFKSGLPAALTVFHGVHWARVEHGIATIGEIDFVVLSPSGRILLIEQKSGFLEEGEGGLARLRLGATRPVRLDVDRTIERLGARLAPIARGDAVPLDYLLYCPDYTVRSPGSAGIAPERIIDHRDRDQLCRRVIDAMGEEPARPELARRLHRFFLNELELAVDASALIGRAADAVTRLSGGLATWARRIELRPQRLRIRATAGAGKTQLALALLQDAASRSRSALFVCYNRPLADHVRMAAPAESRVLTYHQWCQRRLEGAGLKVDFSQAGAFERMETAAAQLTVRESYDCLIVDEGQDFLAGWRDDALRSVRPDGQTWWLEDPMQDLYGRESRAAHDTSLGTSLGTSHDAWPTLHATDNFRSPRRVVDAMNRLLALDPPVIGLGPLAGGEPEFLVYPHEQGPLAQTRAAVPLALRAGFRKQDIAIVTFSGRSRSVLIGEPMLGPNSLKTFNGRYDLFGNPEFTDGELMAETVYRFKGQSAPCVILTEVDFERLEEPARRKLFVGMSRASMHLIVVLSARADRALGHPAGK